MGLADKAARQEAGEEPFKLLEFDLVKFNSILKRGLCSGMGDVGGKGKMCIEAAICTVLGEEEHGDRPTCVHPDIADFKIYLNDGGTWPSDKARSAGLQDLGVAQLGTKDLKRFSRFNAMLEDRLEKAFRKRYQAARLETFIEEELDTKDTPRLCALLLGAKPKNQFEKYFLDTMPAEFNPKGNMDWISIFDDAPFGITHEDTLKVAKIALGVLRDLDAPGIKLLKKLRRIQREDLAQATAKKKSKKG